MKHNEENSFILFAFLRNFLEM